MFNLLQSSKPHRRSRRLTRVLRDAARAGEIEVLEDKALLAEVPQLSSLDTAPVTIFLDFDGHVESGSLWNSQNTDDEDIITPPYDTDGDDTNLTDAEALEIEQIWARVAEDFAPFNVNVTTFPGVETVDYQSILIAVGGDGDWFDPAGGVAFLNSFSNSAPNTAFAFVDNLGGPNVISNVAFTISHEAGHTFGLRHHSLYSAGGAKLDEYHPGTGDWGPIMGGPFGAERIVWDNGPASNGIDDLQDDMAVMTRASNRTFAYREDDHGDDPDSATVPEFGDNGEISIPENILHRHDEVDFFEVETDAGEISFRVDSLDLRDTYGATALNAGNNLDLVLRLYDENGNQLAESNPGGSDFDASIEYTASRGLYYVEVSSIDDYGSAGQYSFEGDVIPLPVTPVMLTPSGITNDATPQFGWTRASNTDTYELLVRDAETTEIVLDIKGITETIYTHTAALPEGVYESAVRQINNQGEASEYSEFLGFEIDIARPGTPQMVAPRGLTNDQTPEFQWEPASGANSYELTVRDQDTKEIVIFRAGIDGLTYEHFAPLRNGKYESTVLAVNEAGEEGVPSTPLKFTITADAAEVPQILTPENNSTETIRRPKITWTSALNSIDYEVRVFSLSANEEVLNVSGLTGTSYKVKAKDKLDQGTYQVEVRGFNVLDEPTDWSPASQFTVDIREPLTPVVTSPDGSTGTQKPEITWEKARYAKSYRIVIVDTGQDDTEILTATVNGGNTLSYVPDIRLPESDFTVFVAGINSVGEIGDYGTMDFDVSVQTPARPEITSPSVNANGTIGIATPTYRWTAVANAFRYDLKVVNLTTDELVIRKRYLTTTSFQDSTKLKDGNIYRVTVRARNTAGENSNFSRAVDFETRFEVPSTPDMIGPVGEVQTRTPVFQFENVDSATRFRLFVKDLNTNSTEMFNVKEWEVDDTGTIASYQLTSSQKIRRGTYQAWIQAVGESASAASGYSNSVSFTVVSAAETNLQGLSNDIVTVNPTLDPVVNNTEVVEPTKPISADLLPEVASTPAAPVEVVQSKPAVTTDVTQPIEEHTDSAAAAMSEFPSIDWVDVVTESDDTSDATTSDSEVGHVVEAAAGILAFPVIAGRLLKRVRTRRKKNSQD